MHHRNVGLDAEDRVVQLNLADNLPRCVANLNLCHWSLLPAAAANHQQSVTPARDGAFNDQQVSVRINADHSEVLHCDPLVAHVAGHPQPLQYSARSGAGRNGPWSPVPVGLAMRLRPTGEAVALHHSGEAFSFAGTDDVYSIAGPEYPNVQPVPDLGVRPFNPDLLQVPEGRKPILLAMPALSLVQFAGLLEADLNRVVSIRLNRLHLRYEAWAGLDDRDSDHPWPLFEQPGHPNLAAHDSVDHALLPNERLAIS